MNRFFFFAQPSLFTRATSHCEIYKKNKSIKQKSNVVMYDRYLLLEYIFFSSYVHIPFSDCLCSTHHRNHRTHENKNTHKTCGIRTTACYYFILYM